MPLTGQFNVQQVLPDPIMSNIAIARMQEGDFIADIISPVVGVAADYGRFAQFGSEAIAQNLNTKRAAGSSAMSVSFSRTYGTFTCTEDAAKTDLHEEDFQGQDPATVREQGIDLTTMQVKIAIETRVQALTVAIANTATVTTKWDAASPTIMKDWLAAREAFRHQYGVYPNAAIITPTIANIMSTDTDIRDYVKYTKPDLLVAGVLPPAMRGVRIIVPTANIRTSLASAALTDIWDNGEKNVTFLYIPPGATYNAATNQSNITATQTLAWALQIKQLGEEILKAGQKDLQDLSTKSAELAASFASSEKASELMAQKVSDAAEAAREAGILSEQAGTQVKSFGDRADEAAKSLRSAFGRGSTFNLLIAGTAVAGLRILGSELNRVGGEVAKAADDFRDGKISGGDFADQVLRSIPLLGEFYSAGANFTEAITGIGHAEKEAEAQTAALNKELNEQAKGLFTIQKQADDAAAAIRKIRDAAAAKDAAQEGGVNRRGLGAIFNSGAQSNEEIDKQLEGNQKQIDALQARIVSYNKLLENGIASSKNIDPDLGLNTLTKLQDERERLLREANQAASAIDQANSDQRADIEMEAARKAVAGYLKAWEDGYAELVKLDKSAIEAAGKRWDEHVAALRKEASQLEDSLRTPAEKFQATLAELAALKQVGVLDPETEKRATEKATADFDKAQSERVAAADAATVAIAEGAEKARAQAKADYDRDVAAFKQMLDGKAIAQTQFDQLEIQREQKLQQDLALIYLQEQSRKQIEQDKFNADLATGRAKVLAEAQLQYDQDVASFKEAQLRKASPPPSSNALIPGNIDLYNRPIAKNDDGSISTVRSITVEVGDGKFLLLPTVSDDGRVLSNVDAIKQYQKSGKHLGLFSSEEQADAYGESLHDSQAQQYLPVAQFMAQAAAKLEETIRQFDIARSQAQGAADVTIANANHDKVGSAIGTLNLDQSAAQEQARQQYNQGLLDWTKYQQELTAIDQQFTEKRKAVDGNFFEGFKIGLQNTVDQAKTISQIGQQVGQDLANGIAGALGDIATGTKGVSQAFKEMAASIIQDIIRMTIQFEVSSIFQAFLGGFGALTPSGSPLGHVAIAPRNAGGLIGYALGGMVGSGPWGPNKDTVPAALTLGEFVVNREAVSRPGMLGLLDNINRGGAARVQTTQFARAPLAPAPTQTNGAAGGGAVIAAVVASDAQMRGLLSGGRNATLDFFQANAQAIRSRLGV